MKKQFRVIKINDAYITPDGDIVYENGEGREYVYKGYGIVSNSTKKLLPDEKIYWRKFSAVNRMLNLEEKAIQSTENV